MNEQKTKGFFAYPSQPKTIPEIAGNVTEILNGRYGLSITPWEKARIGGKIIIREICRIIDESDLFLADITGINANVMFEFGYTIARNKRIWRCTDTSRSSFKRDFEQFGLLTGVGYRSYANSDEILRHS